MSTSTSTTKKNSIALFLAWPFFALFYAIRNYKASWAKDIIWLFVVFYGFTMTIKNADAEITVDANRYRDKFIDMAKEDVDFENITAQFYDEDSKTLDVLELVIIFTVSRFTGNYHVLFAVFGLIFGYFYSRNIWYLIDRVQRKIPSANIPIILTFVFIVGFWQINGFRFWTATHIFLFGALPFLFEGKKMYLWFAALSALMHFSFLLPVSILAIYLLSGNRTTLFFALFITTYFIRELDVNQLGDFLTNNLPEIFVPRVKTYTNEANVESVNEIFSQASWFIRTYEGALKWSVFAFIVVIFSTGKVFLKNNKNFSNLYSFTLLFYSIANIFSLVPSGGRFIYLANLFAIAFIFFYVLYAPKGKLLKRIIFISVPALAFFSIVSIRIGLESMGFFSVLGNPFLSLFIEVDITIIEVLKSLF